MFVQIFNNLVCMEDTLLLLRQNMYIRNGRKASSPMARDIFLKNSRLNAKTCLLASLSSKIAQRNYQCLDEVRTQLSDLLTDSHTADGRYHNDCRKNSQTPIA